MTGAEEKVIERKFSDRPLDLQQDLLQQTWCNTCMEMDLGMKNAKEYQSGDRIWIEGECLKCGGKVITEIEEEE